MLAVITYPAGHLSAAPILTLAGSDLNVTSISTTTNLLPIGGKLDGYNLFNPMDPSFVSIHSQFGLPDVTVFPGAYATYSSIGTDGSLSYWDGSGGFTTITANGTSYRTGAYYTGVSGALGTITLAAGVPSSFRLGVLMDNNGDYNLTNITLTLGTSSVTLTSAGVSGRNDIYYADITGITSANVGDVITITGSNVHNQPEIGGLTFSAVPEPSTWAMMVVAALGMIGIRRLRRRSAA